MIDNINLSISSSIENIAEYLGVIRLTTSAVSNKIGFNIDEIDDIKVSIGEACTNIIKHGISEDKGNIDISYFLYSDKLVISIKDKGKGFDISKIKEPNIEELNESGLGIFIIKSLMDEVEIISDETGTEIKMTKIKDL